MQTLAEYAGLELDARALELNLGKRRPGEPDAYYRDRLAGECERRSGFGRPIDMSYLLRGIDRPRSKPRLHVRGGCWTISVRNFDVPDSYITAAARFATIRNALEGRQSDPCCTAIVQCIHNR